MATPDLNTSCYRTSLAYPYLLQNFGTTNFNFVACSGATISDVENSQLSALNSSTSTVTISVGADDLGWQNQLSSCPSLGFSSSCSGNADLNPALFEQQNGGIAQSLDGLFAQIAARAPYAHVIVVGYPHPFAYSSCGGAGLMDAWFPTNVRQNLNSVVDWYASIEQTEASKYGFTFVDMRNVFAGHEMCSSAPWLVNPLDTSLSEANWFHPTATAHRAMAWAVYMALPSDSSGLESAIHLSNGDLWTEGPGGSGDTGLGLWPGTSPSLAANGYVAFHANSNTSVGNLWIGGSSTDLGLWAGTSPSITNLLGGGWEVAFNANGSGDLWTYGSNGQATDWGPGLKLQPGTSPSIAALPSGGWQVAFHANSDGGLWTLNSNGQAHQWYLGLWPGTNPSINTSGEVAFEANGSSNLWTVGSGGAGNMSLGMMPGTNPSINDSGEIAFQANTGTLWTNGPNGRGPWDLAMAPGTSPSLSDLGEVAVQGSNGHLWTAGPGGAGDTSQPMMAGTSPSIHSPAGFLGY